MGSDPTIEIELTSTGRNNQSLQAFSSATGYNSMYTSSYAVAGPSNHVEQITQGDNWDDIGLMGSEFP